MLYSSESVGSQEIGLGDSIRLKMPYALTRHGKFFISSTEAITKKLEKY